MAYRKGRNDIYKVKTQDFITWPKEKVGIVILRSLVIGVNVVGWD